MAQRRRLGGKRRRGILRKRKTFRRSKTNMTKNIFGYSSNSNHLRKILITFPVYALCNTTGTVGLYSFTSSIGSPSITRNLFYSASSASLLTDDEWVNMTRSFAFVSFKGLRLSYTRAYVTNGAVWSSLPDLYFSLFSVGSTYTNYNNSSNFTAHADNALHACSLGLDSAPISKYFSFPPIIAGIGNSANDSASYGSMVYNSVVEVNNSKATFTGLSCNMGWNFNPMTPTTPASVVITVIGTLTCELYCQFFGDTGASASYVPA